MNSIDKTVVIGENVQIGENNIIWPHVVIEDGVRLGSNNIIHPGAVIFKGTTIGDDNHIHSGAILGDAPQDIAFKGESSFLQIGNRNHIREYCTIHRGTDAGSKTMIGDDNFLMGYTHVAHNCTIGNGVVTVNTAVLGGHVTVQDKAFISASVVIHQYCRIGKFAMVSGLSAITQDVPPYMTVGGRPAVAFSVNVVGLRRGGFSPEVRTDIKRAYKLLYRSDLSVTHALNEIENGSRSTEVSEFVAFCQSSKRGIIAGGSSEDAKL
jgi:UDP-N-acetylglucosamine acyltransferase